MPEQVDNDLWVTAFRKGRRMEINMRNGEERQALFNGEISEKNKDFRSNQKVIVEENNCESMLSSGIRLFRSLSILVEKGDAVGVTYEQFWALIHGVNDFEEVEGRHFELTRDVKKVLSVAHRITATNGRIKLNCGEASINSGMDSFIWDSQCRRFKSVFMSTPYSEAQWLSIFPNNKRRLLKSERLD